MFLGLRIPARYANFDSPTARRVVRLAHEQHNLQRLPQLQLAQARFERRSPSRRFYRTRYVKAGIDGFQCLIKQEPGDYLVSEPCLRRFWSPSEQEGSFMPPSLPRSTSPLPIDDPNALILAALGDGEISNEMMVQHPPPATQGEETCTTIQSFAHKLFLRLSQAPMDYLSVVEDTGADFASTLTCSPRVDGACTKRQPIEAMSRNSLLVLACRDSSNRRHLVERQLSLELWLCFFNDATTSIPSVHDGSVSASSLSRSRSLMARRLEPRVRLLSSSEDDGDSVVRLSLCLVPSPNAAHLSRCVAGGEPALLENLRQLVANLCTHCRNEWLDTEVESETNSRLRSSGSGSAVLLCSHRLAWKRASDDALQRKSRSTGALLKGHGEGANRHGVAVSRGEAQEALQHLDQWLQRIATGCGKTHADAVVSQSRVPMFTIWGDRDGVVVDIWSPSRFCNNKGNAEPSELLPTETASRSLIIRKGEHEARRKDFEVVEFVLERVGLPHSFVLHDLADELRIAAGSSLSRNQGQRRSSAAQHHGNDNIEKEMAVVVSHHGSLGDARTRTFQICRVRGSTLRDVCRLSQRLADGEVLSNLQIPAAAQTDSSTHSRRHRHLSLDWSAASSARRHANSDTVANNNDVVSGKKTAEYVEAWKTHYYRIHAPRLVWKAAVAAAGGDDARPYTVEVQTVSGSSDDDANDERRNEFSDSYFIAKQVATRLSFAAACSRAATLAMEQDLSPAATPHSFYDYQLTLRHIPQEDRQKAHTAVESLVKYGFVNYHALCNLPFSSAIARAMLPGLHLLKGEFSAAATVLLQALSARGDEDPFAASLDADMESEAAEEQRLRCAKGERGHHHYDDSAAAAALRQYRRTRNQSPTQGRTNVAKEILRQALTYSPAASANETCKEVFLHVLGPSVVEALVRGFLYYVWNDVASQRIREFGPLSAAAGDLYWRAVDDDNSKAAAAATGTAGRGVRMELAVATQEDVDRGRVSPYQVVIPVPGANIQLPRNRTGDILRTTLERSYGITWNAERQEWPCFLANTAMNPRVTVRENGSSNTCMISVDDWRNPTSNGAHKMLRVVEDDDGNGEAGSAQCLIDGSSSTSIAALSREGGGNALGITFQAEYRALLARPQLHHWELRPDDGSETNEIRRLRWGRGNQPRPYYLPRSGPYALSLTLSLPQGTFPDAMLRELSKLDVNMSTMQFTSSGEDDATQEGREDMQNRAPSPQQRRALKKERARQSTPPAALYKALLHQTIFRSNGMRHSLLPTMRGRDDVAKTTGTY